MPNLLNDKLQEIAKQVSQGDRPSETVRTILSWNWGAERRGRWIVREVRNALDRYKLDTDPNFEYAYIDGLVTFVPKVEKAPGGTPASESAAESNLASPPGAATAEAAATQVFGDPTYRIGKLASANRPPISVAPDAPISEAITIMLEYDFSQLPVMTSERDVKGLTTWESIGSRFALGRQGRSVREFMDQANEMSADASLFSAINLIAQEGCVLVRDSSNKITGIVTASDLTLQFGQLGEPFLVLGEIENHIRGIIDGKFTKEELEAVRDPGDSTREVHDVSDLTFGEYLRLLEDPRRWEKLNLRIDRRAFTKDLDEVRRIRNDVMHFDPDGIGEDDLATLRRFVQFLQRLRRLSG
jgi:CBS domain-containing protein